MTSRTTYDAAVDAQRRPQGRESGQVDLHELIRLGSLAASSHNTQPWRFRIEDQTIHIEADFSRRCPVVDPQDAHLYKSLGCAAENISQGAAARGGRADVTVEGGDGDESHVVVHLTPDPTSTETALARAITSRQCTKTSYDGQPVSGDDLAALEHASRGDGVRAIFFTERDDITTLTEFVNKGNLAQLSDPAFRKELVAWIRSNDRESLNSGDGLSGRTSGQPSVPTWLARWLIPMLIRPTTQMKTDARNITSSAGIVVFVSDRDDVASWVEVGRCYERFALQATALGVRNAFINQPIEVPSLRPALEQWLGLDGERAQLMVRFGHGPEMPFSVRRPLDEIIITPQR